MLYTRSEAFNRNRSKAVHSSHHQRRRLPGQRDPRAVGKRLLAGSMQRGRYTVQAAFGASDLGACLVPLSLVLVQLAFVDLAVWV
jgi:hypothetical protein